MATSRGSGLATLDRAIAETTLTIRDRATAYDHRRQSDGGGRVMAAIRDIARFKSPQKLVSYFGLNPRVRQSGLGAAHHGRISKVGRRSPKSCPALVNRAV